MTLILSRHLKEMGPAELREKNRHLRLDLNVMKNSFLNSSHRFYTTSLIQLSYNSLTYSCNYLIVAQTKRARHIGP